MSAPLGESQMLVLSILAPMSNRIKMCVMHPKKNKELACDPDFRNFIFALCEQLLPQWCQMYIEDPDVIKDMHTLLFLFSQKTHQVF